MRALVTGATGFIGANLVRRLLSDGVEVGIVVRQGHRPWRIEQIRSRVKVHTVSLANRGEVFRLIEQLRPNWVFNLAAYGAYSHQTEVDRMLETNVVSLVNLADAALNVGADAIVQAGSSSEYGLKDHAPSEDEAVNPNSHYAATKAQASLYCRFLADHAGAPVTVLRIYSAYGPWEEPTRLVPTLVVRGLNRRLPPLVSPKTARDFVYVEDVVEAFVLTAVAGRAPSPLYNIGTGCQSSIASVVETCRAILPTDDKPVWGSMSARSWDTSSWVADPSRAATELGWQPRHTLADGLRRFVEWLQADTTNLARYQRDADAG